MSYYPKKVVVFGMLMFAFLAVGLMVAQPACAQPTDLCLKVIIQENELGPLPTVQRFTVNMHLQSTDGVHFTAWGKVRIPKETFYLGGTGIMEGDVITMNLSTSQKHTDGWRDSGAMQVKYNIVTGRGSFYEIGHDFKVGTGFDQRYTAGILRQCP